MAYGYAVYFAERPRNRVVRWDPDKGETRIVAGGSGVQDPTQRLSDPYGLAFDPDGFLLISDKLNHRICRLRNGRLEELALRDVDGHRKLLPGNSPRFGAERLQCPSSLYAERAGSLLCAFYDDNTIYRIHRDGRLELVVGIVPQGLHFHDAPREFVPPERVRSTSIFAPVGIVGRADGTLYFIERQSQVVREFHPQRGLRSLFPHAQALTWSRKNEAPPRGAMKDYFPPLATTLALDLEESLYLCEPGHSAVFQLDSERNSFERVVYTPRGSGRSLYSGPVAVAFGGDGTAWVADAASQTIQGYKKSSSLPWAKGQAVLDQVRGEPLSFGGRGMGMVVGP